MGTISYKGADGNAKDVSAAQPLPVTLQSGADGATSTGTVTSVNDTNADTTILAANAARYGASVYNDSTAILYLLVGAGTSSASNFTVKLQPDQYYEVPFGYTGILKGIWSADASGAARVTEWT